LVGRGLLDVLDWVCGDWVGVELSSRLAWSMLLELTGRLLDGVEAHAAHVAHAGVVRARCGDVIIEVTGQRDHFAFNGEVPDIRLIHYKCAYLSLSS
jgi:hypothetical protein